MRQRLQRLRKTLLYWWYVGTTDAHPDFILLSLTYRGTLLQGNYAHCCFEWDELPVDETCPEWPCGCVWAKRRRQILELRGLA